MGVQLRASVLSWPDRWGEFGAVKVVPSGNIVGETRTATLAR